MKRVLSGLSSAVLIGLLTVTTVGAQGGATAQITGLVRDQSAGVLPGADVTVTQTDTGFKRTVVSDSDGAFSFPNIPIGPYRLEVMLQGFRSYVQTGIVLQVNSSPAINVTLALGQVAETVTVQGESPLIDTGKMGVGQVLDNRKILDLPLNGRNVAALIETLPAAVPVPALNATSRSMQGGLAYSVAGGQSFGVTYTLDGATHNNPYDNLNLPLPFPDALQEARIETSAMTAQNGMHAGASLTAVTKSGSNRFRGDAFEFFRHHSLNATDPFAAKNPDGSRKDDGLKRNQYGATLGGPIKADRVFFFAGYQGTNTRVIPTDNRAFVPTAAMLAGDFTAYASPACNAGRQVNLPASFGFAGNRINPALFSPAALNITGKLTTSTDPCGLVQYGLPSSTDDVQFVGKVDYQVNTKHSLFGRYIPTNVVTAPPYSLDAAEQNLLVTRQGGRDNLAQTFTVGENWVISPSTLNAFRFAFNRTSIHRTSTDFFSAPSVGVNIYSYMPNYMLLTVGTAVGANVNGFQLGGGTESESTFNTNAWQFSDDVTLVRGTHQFAFGANAARWTSLSLANVRSPGQLTVTGAVTGLPLTDFLLGRLGLNGLVQAAPNTLDMQQTYFGIYAQDTWRMGTRVTLNYGLRWEPFFPPQLVNGAVYQFDITRFQQNVHSTVFPKGPAGLYFPGDTGFPTQAGMLTDWNNLGPRVGAAWDPTGNGLTSVRAAYGRSYEFVNAQFHLNTSVAPPWGSEVRLNNPPGGLDNPFVGSGQTNIFPVTFDQNAPFSLNGPFLSLSNNMQATSVDMWNLTLERQLGARWVASAGYVGSRTNNIWESEPINNALPIPVPGTGAAPAVGNTNDRRPLTIADRSNGQYYGPLDVYVTDGSQRYDGMLLTIRGSGKYGSTVGANYTLSHCHGSPEGGGGGTTNVSTGYNKPTDHHFDDGNCTADRLHNFSLIASVESARQGNSAWGTFASGWRLVGSFRALTGPWLTISPGVGNDRALNGQSATQRVNQILDDPYGDDSTQPGGGRQFLNPLAFEQPALGTHGTMVRNSVRGVGSKTVDFSLSRVFRLANSHNIEVRAEAFNAFNWFQWAQPNVNLNSPTFGQITSTSTTISPRVFQFAAKYVF
jgi:Carboxypeptidase regulatory-like domain/TonB dependent receptor-like, beta-barrel